MTTTASLRGTALSVEAADKIIKSLTLQSKTESVPLEKAGGRVLREDIRADRDFPPFDRVAMDGVAFSFAAYRAGTRSFNLEGVQAAGAPQATLSDGSGCVEVMTGAILPRGCDCVVPVEELTMTETAADLVGERVIRRHQNIHRRASDHERGEVLLRSGIRLRSTELAVCATVGKCEVAVSRLPSVAVVSTGNELVEVDQIPDAHQIRASNGYAVEGAIRRSGLARTERFHACDDGEALERLFSDLLTRFDTIVVTGGISVGKFDLVRPVLEGIGVQTLFQKIAQRPGRPVLFGVFENEKTVFGLPGNPVSALVAAHRYVIPFLESQTGVDAPPRAFAAISEDYSFEAPLTLFVPVKAEDDGSGRLLARPVRVNGSGDLAGLAASDGFIELPQDMGYFAAGSVWPFTKWQ